MALLVLAPIVATALSRQIHEAVIFDGVIMGLWGAVGIYLRLNEGQLLKLRFFIWAVLGVLTVMVMTSICAYIIKIFL